MRLNATKYLTTFKGSVLGALMALLPLMSFASTPLANQDLQRALHELNAAKVYIIEAKLQSPPHQRIVFHYQWLLNDINTIESGIGAKFQMPSIEPRMIAPIQGDYIGVVGKGPKA